MDANNLKAVLVGCGGMSKAWLDVATKMDGLSITGLVDLNPAMARERAEMYGLSAERVYTSLADAIQAGRPDIVFDVTIPAAHKQVTLEALAAGCHVLGEKPMAESMEDARDMVKAAHQANRLYAVIQNRRYESNILRVRSTLATGQLGVIEEVHSDFFLGPHFTGFRAEMDDPLLVDMAIHTFDQARLISGADPVAVYCHGFNPGRSWYRGNASAVAIFEMSDGIVYTYRGSWCAEGLPTSWEAQWRVICRQGTLTWDGADGIRAQAVKQGTPAATTEVNELPIEPYTLERQRHAALIHEFVDCVRTGRNPQTICDDNIKSLAMVLAAVESSRTRQRVKVAW